MELAGALGELAFHTLPHPCLLSPSPSLSLWWASHLLAFGYGPGRTSGGARALRSVATLDRYPRADALVSIWPASALPS